MLPSREELAGAAAVAETGVENAATERAIVFFTCVAHALTHVYMLIWPTVMAPMREAFGLSVAEFTAYATISQALFGLGALNLQVAVYRELGVGLASSPFGTLFYAVTGGFLIALLVGLVLAVVTAFRSLGGRYAATDTDGVAAFALYWHFLTVAFCAVWFVVYVNK